NHFYSKFENSSYTLKKSIVQKLYDAPRLSPNVKLELAKQIGQFNGGLLVDVFTLFTKHRVKDKATLSMISELLKDDNHFKATQAAKYLNSVKKDNSSSKIN